MSIRLFGRLGRNIGWSVPLRGDPLFWLAVAIAVLINTCWPQKANGQQLIVDVQLIGVGTTTVEGLLTKDSLLLLPARPVHDLLGLAPPTTQWISDRTLRAQWPTAEITVDLRRLTVFINDPTRVFPATRRALDQQIRAVQGAPSFAIRSGPFVGVAADDREHSLLDVGYTWKGRVLVQGRHTSAFGSAWGATIAPSPRLYLTYADGDRQQPTASARVAVGRTWAFATWTPERWHADGLVQVGRVSLFASTREIFAVTINAAPVGIQVGRTGQHTTARLTYGNAMMPSPFMAPTVP